MLIVENVGLAEKHKEENKNYLSPLSRENHLILL